MARKKLSPPLNNSQDKPQDQPSEKKAGSKKNKTEEVTPPNDEKPLAKKAATSKTSTSPEKEKKAAPKKAAKKAAQTPATETPSNIDTPISPVLPNEEAVEAETTKEEAKPAKKAATRKPATRKKAVAEPKAEEEQSPVESSAVAEETIKPVPVAEEKNEEAVHRLAHVGHHAIEKEAEEKATVEQISEAEPSPVAEEKNEEAVERLAKVGEHTIEKEAEEKQDAVTELSEKENSAEPEAIAPVITAAEEAPESTSTPANANKDVHVRFIVTYYTKPGQNLYIFSQHPLFGNGNPDQAFQMQYLDSEHWQADVMVPASTEDFDYHYILKEEDGTLVYDGGKDKTLTPSLYAKDNVLIQDSWDFAGYYDNAFETEPFRKVLLKNNYTPTEVNEPDTFTHEFRVKAPLLSQGQVACLTGSTDALKNWDTHQPYLLSRKEEEEDWHIRLNITEAHYPLYYKYGVFDINKQQLVQLENGENRALVHAAESDAQTIVNDGFIRTPDNTWKGAGVAIPVFSLRTNEDFGCGEFTDIKKLVDWSKSVGLKLIQLLPVNDTTSTKTWRDSYPYAAISAFALHAMYLNVDEMTSEENKHLIEGYREEAKRLNGLPEVDYEAVNDIKWKIIHDVYPLQKEATLSSADYISFFEDNKHWLEPYAAFCSLRDRFNTADFTKWNEYKTYNQNIVSSLMQSDEKNRLEMYYFVQYHLHLQLKEATEYAHSNGIIIKGDIAIGIARNSADAWQNPDLYNMDMQAGAPPDAFAVKGQNWGFPTYNWQRMKEDGFAWWKQRFSQMSNYFDAFRIDHILGFFRIWSIPTESVEGIMGHFVPALPVHINEFHQWNTYFDYKRYVKPYITDQVLQELCGDQQQSVKDTFLVADTDGKYSLKPEVSTQKRVETYFAIRDKNEHNDWLKQVLFDLISNVILFEEKGSNGQLFHFRFGMEKTSSYQHLDDHTKHQLYFLSVNYFYERQNEFWRQEAMQKLPALKQETDMLICGEDLGLVPASVPRVMQELGLLSLEVQRMPKDESASFTNLERAPYLSVVTPSTHDMSTIRGWWEEDRNLTQTFYNNQLGQGGEAPQYCEPWINKQVVEQHLYSPAMWSIFQLQDLMGIDGDLRRPNPNEERINVPAIPNYYWRYRMHLSLEDLMNEQSFNSELKESITASGR